MPQNATWPSRDDDRQTSPSAAETRPGQGMFAWYAQGFSDPLGDRLLLFDNTSGAPLELLRLRPELSSVPGFESAVRERAAALDGFNDARYARVCRVDRLADPGGGLAIVSDGTEGQRLSDILHIAEQRHLQPGADTIRRLVGEVVAAAAAFHAAGPDMVHGALGPQRLVVSPGGTLLVTEYVLGSALARVPLDRTMFWRSLRLALPPDPDVPSFTQQTDVMQVGTIALALVLGRMLREDEYPSRLTELVAEADDRLLLGGWGPLREPFHTWLLRMLHVDHDRPIADGVEARRALADVMSGDGGGRVGEGTGEWFIRACSRNPPALNGFAGGQIAEARPALPAAAAGVAIDAEDAALESFATTSNEEAGEPRAQALLPEETPALPAASVASETVESARATVRWKRAAIIALLVIAVAEGLFIGARALVNNRAAPPIGAVSIESSPARATIVVDGKRVGVTPIRLELAAGRHVLEVSAGDQHRTITVTATPGTTVSQYVELPQVQPQTGKLRIVTAPAGGRIAVDGKAMGISPLLVADLVPGKHEVVVDTPDGPVRQSVDVEQNSTASLFMPLPGTRAPAPGWLAVTAPLDLTLYEDGELVGTSKSARIMLPAGVHLMQLVAEGVGYKTTREVQVLAGKTVTIDVIPPKSRVDINALPWAQVLIDNQPVGDTPLSGVMVPIGRHVITFRHPELGERSVDCLVTLQGPARVSVDLRK